MMQSRAASHVIRRPQPGRDRALRSPDACRTLPHSSCRSFRPAARHSELTRVDGESDLVVAPAPGQRKALQFRQPALGVVRMPVIATRAPTRSCRRPDHAIEDFDNATSCSSETISLSMTLRCAQGAGEHAATFRSRRSLPVFYRLCRRETQPPVIAKTVQARRSLEPVTGARGCTFVMAGIRDRQSLSAFREKRHWCDDLPRQRFWRTPNADQGLPHQVAVTPAYHTKNWPRPDLGPTRFRAVLVIKRHIATASASTRVPSRDDGCGRAGQCVFRIFVAQFRQHHSPVILSRRQPFIGSACSALLGEVWEIAVWCSQTPPQRARITTAFATHQGVISRPPPTALFTTVHGRHSGRAFSPIRMSDC